MALMRGLCTKDPTGRLGANGVEEIQRHRFFAGVAWDQVLAKGLPMEWVPEITDLTDARQFDPSGTAETAFDTDERPLPPAEQGKFQSFGARAG
jgi:hypothetical protein